MLFLHMLCDMWKRMLNLYKKEFDSVDHGYNFAEASARAPYVTDFCIVNHLYTLLQH